MTLPSQDICLGLAPLTWLDAATHCENHGSHLVRIDSPAENQAIAEALRPRRANVQAWIDLSDREQEGSWRTSVDDTQVYAWLDGEPNDFGGGEDCVEFLLPDGRWNDVDCGAARMPLCERSAAIRAAE